MGKTQIVPFKCGISFTSFHHYVTAEGKYIRKLNGSNKRRSRKNIHKWIELVKVGKMPEEKFTKNIMLGKTMHYMEIALNCAIQWICM